MRLVKCFKEFLFKGVTPSRYMMHKALMRNDATIISPCVDLGGWKSQSQTYLDYFSFDEKEKIILGDITPEADVYCDLEKNLPFGNEQFKTVLLINVICLIFNYEQVFEEIYRVLEKDGKAYIWTSLNANTHPHPNDYFRFTDQALIKIFEKIGFSRVEVRPYGGIGLTIGTYMGQLTQKIKIISSIIHLMSYGFNKIIDRIEPEKNTKKWPLGYLCILTK